MKQFLISLLILVLGVLPAFADNAGIRADTLNLGAETSVDKSIKFHINAGSANPVIKAEQSTGKLKFSDDGTNFYTVAKTLPTISVVTAGSHIGGFSANGSGTYTTPSGVLYIRVKMVGGGGGGQGSSTSGWAPTAGIGGTTTFGTSLLTATGGNGGSIQGGPGGTPTVNSPAITFAASIGSYGGCGQNKSSSTELASGYGASTPLGGGSTGNLGATVGYNGLVNTGGGASGGSLASAASGTIGGGGGGGAYIDAVIYNPLSTYTYSVGAGGAAGAAGSGGQPGGAGGSGIIIVEEYYK